MAKKLNEISNLPQMDETLTDWFYPIQLIKITTTIVNYEAVQTTQYINTKGDVQPLTEEEISLKPEEQRSWSWLQVHTMAKIQLQVGDKLLFDSVRYRVMARKPYYLYGYMEYHLVQDYEGSINAN